MIGEVCSGAILGGVAWRRAYKWVDGKMGGLKWDIQRIDNKVRSYNEQFVHPKDEFLWKWAGEPGKDQDFEILEWCVTHGVRYKYLRDCNPHAYPKNCFEVWIIEPRLAMEFKLRWYNT